MNDDKTFQTAPTFHDFSQGTSNFSVDASFFNCSICLDIAENAVESTCCTTLFCENCVDEYKERSFECPKCGIGSFFVRDSTITRRIVATLPMECPLGCSSKLTRSDVTAHLIICEYKPTKDVPHPLNCPCCGGDESDEENFDGQRGKIDNNNNNNNNNNKKKKKVFHHFIEDPLPNPPLPSIPMTKEQQPQQPQQQEVAYQYSEYIYDDHFPQEQQEELVGSLPYEPAYDMRHHPNEYYDEYGEYEEGPYDEAYDYDQMPPMMNSDDIPWHNSQEEMYELQLEYEATAANGGVVVSEQQQHQRQQEENEEEVPRTVVCRHWESGKCWYGKECMFAHSYD